MDKQLKITIIGAGNVATHLAHALARTHVIEGIFSRNINNANEITKKTGGVAFNQLSEIPKKSDIYIISVSDDAIAGITNHLTDIEGVVTHTSGSTPMEALNGIARHGVFYPFQTFSKHKDVNMSEVPLLIEANNSDDKTLLMKVASSISDNVSEATSQQRLKLHIAAVFACNFTNHMYVIAEEILNNASLSFNLLHPLLIETANKACTASPLTAQTGPAVRGDRGVINLHIDMLSSNKEQQDIYRKLSESIAEKHGTDIKTTK